MYVLPCLPTLVSKFVVIKSVVHGARNAPLPTCMYVHAQACIDVVLLRTFLVWMVWYVVLVML